MYVITQIRVAVKIITMQGNLLPHQREGVINFVEQTILEILPEAFCRFPSHLHTQIDQDVRLVFIMLIGFMRIDILPCLVSFAYLAEISLQNVEDLIADLHLDYHSFDAGDENLVEAFLIYIPVVIG